MLINTWRNEEALAIHDGGIGIIQEPGMSGVIDHNDVNARCEVQNGYSLPCRSNFEISSRSRFYRTDDFRGALIRMGSPFCGALAKDIVVRRYRSVCDTPETVLVQGRQLR